MKIQDFEDYDIFFLFFYQDKILSDLEEVHEYYDRVEYFFDNDAEKLEQEFENKAEKINLSDSNQRHDLIAKYGREIIDSQSAFPELLKNSLLITIYSLTEIHLSEICRFFERKNISKIKLKDLNGKGIEKSKKFLTKIAEIDFSSINSQWNFLKSLNLIRNNLVHNGSILPKDADHKLNRIVESCPKLSGDPGKCLIINDGFIQLTIDGLMDFFNGLFKIIRNRLVIDQNSSGEGKNRWSDK